MDCGLTMDQLEVVRRGLIEGKDFDTSAHKILREVLRDVIEVNPERNARLVQSSDGYLVMFERELLHGTRTMTCYHPSCQKESSVCCKTCHAFYTCSQHHSTFVSDVVHKEYCNEATKASVQSIWKVLIDGAWAVPFDANAIGSGLNGSGLMVSGFAPITRIAERRKADNALAQMTETSFHIPTASAAMSAFNRGVPLTINTSAAALAPAASAAMVMDIRGMPPSSSDEKKKSNPSVFMGQPVVNVFSSAAPPPSLQFYKPYHPTSAASAAAASIRPAASASMTDY